MADFIIIQIITKLIPKEVFMSRRSFSVVTLKHLVSEKCREISEEFQTNLEQKLIKFRENNDA